MKIVTSALLILCLALGGCTQSDILTSLEASVAATEAVVVALEMTGKIPPDVASEIENSISTLPDAYKQTTAELASADDATTRALKIASYYATTVAALNVLPPAAQPYVAAIQASIQAFLSAVSTGQKQLTASRPAASAPPKLDARKLAAIQRQADALKVKLDSLQSK